MGEGEAAGVGFTSRGPCLWGVWGAEAQRGTWAGSQQQLGSPEQGRWPGTAAVVAAESTAWPLLAQLPDLPRVVSTAGRERPRPQSGPSASGCLGTDLSAVA